jgi:hypothetical protein
MEVYGNGTLFSGYSFSSFQVKRVLNFAQLWLRRNVYSVTIKIFLKINIGKIHLENFSKLLMGKLYPCVFLLFILFF